MTQHIFHCCRGEHTRPALIIRCPIELSTKTARRSLKGPGNGKLKQMVRKFPTFRFERKKRTTSGGSPQFPNGFFGKLPFHLTLNRNFRIFWLNGSRPRFPPFSRVRSSIGESAGSIPEQRLVLEPISYVDWNFRFVLV